MERTGGWRDAGGRKEGWLPVDWREKEGWREEWRRLADEGRRNEVRRRGMKKDCLTREMEN